MAPQAKKPVPAKYVEPLKAASSLIEAAYAQRDKLVGDALKAGASIYAVAELLGLSDSTVLRIGHSQGWPTAAMKAEREAAAAERRRWEEMTEPELIARQAEAQRLITELLLGPQEE